MCKLVFLKQYLKPYVTDFVFVKTYKMVVCFYFIQCKCELQNPAEKKIKNKLPMYYLSNLTYIKMINNNMFIVIMCLLVAVISNRGL